VTSWEEEARWEPDGSTIEGLIQLIDLQVSLLVSVATDGPRIVEVDALYSDRRRRINKALAQLGMSPVFPWHSLWDWHAYWSTHFTTYAGRRTYIRQIAAPVIDELEQRANSTAVTDWGHALTFDSLEQRLDGLKAEVEAARTLDDFQDVGRRCREVLIAAVNLIFDDSMTDDRAVPKTADAKARFELVLTAKAAGASHAELRKLMRASWDLAQDATHSSSATRVDALAAAQATVLIVRVLAEMAHEG
jgi:hypothetical protein